MCHEWDGFIRKTSIRDFSVIAKCSEQSGWRKTHFQGLLWILSSLLTKKTLNSTNLLLHQLLREIATYGTENPNRAMKSMRKYS